MWQVSCRLRKLTAIGVDRMRLRQIAASTKKRQSTNLVRIVDNISATSRPDTPRSHNLGDIWNVADAVTGFMVGSRFGLVIYLVFFYLDMYMVNFFLLHNSEDVSVPPTTGTCCSNCQYYPQNTWTHMWCTPLWWRYCAVRPTFPTLVGTTCHLGGPATRHDANIFN